MAGGHDEGWSDRSERSLEDHFDVVGMDYGGYSSRGPSRDRLPGVCC